MKKALCLVLSLALLLPLTGVLQTDAAAEPPPDTVAEPPTEPPTDVAPEPPVDEETFILHERYVKYQLSEEQLTVPTEELVETVLDYPYLCELLTSNTGSEDTPYPAYDSVRRCFNGLVELEGRVDAASVMLSKLNELVVTGDLSESPAFGDAYFLNILLNVPVFQEKLNTSEVVAYAQTRDAYRSVKEDLASIEAPEVSEILLDVPQSFSIGEYTYTLSSTSGSTTSGTTVPLYTVNKDFTDEERTLNENLIVNIFGVKLLGNATTKYNCHSYAWYDTSTSNKFWIGYDGSEVKLYTNDKHCTRTSSPSVGSIVVYYDKPDHAAHSAIVTSINGSTIMCKSKWGQAGLYEHKLENVPIDYLNNGVLDCKYYTYTRSHSTTTIIDNTSTHTKKCNICGWSATEKHTTTVSIVNSTTHRRVCRVCGWSTTENHNNEITINDSSTHMRRCKTCGWFATEPHVEDPKTGRCVTCGLKGPFTIIITKVPELPEDECEHLDE